MKKLYSLFFSFFIFLNASAAFKSILYAAERELSDTSKTKTPAKITDTRPDKPPFLNSGVGINLVPFKPNTKSATIAPIKNNGQEDDKVISNVKVYPNPIEDSVNLSYNLNKESNVTIKIMDILGNEITTLLSQKIPAGEQLNTFNIASKLNSGFYFIRLIVGSESVVKRISVL
ncbi:T9SS type A sorting domain-containing protein [Rubrolithibacter danxiaensis]|uniref:T9SS type A sorting domain-containing protein n=1 Tax=Rubrolithibacter danxiaensis TaxID=3390805 RepID=UPI003BF8560D